MLTMSSILTMLTMLTRKYKAAARQFLEASLDYCDCPDLMSPNNVAVYGGLCALATFDRTELLKQVGRAGRSFGDEVVYSKSWHELW